MRAYMDKLGRIDPGGIENAFDNGVLQCASLSARDPSERYSSGRYVVIGRGLRQTMLALKTREAEISKAAEDEILGKHLYPKEFLAAIDKHFSSTPITQEDIAPLEDFFSGDFELLANPPFDWEALDKAIESISKIQQERCTLRAQWADQVAKMAAMDRDNRAASENFYLAFAKRDAGAGTLAEFFSARKNRDEA